MRAWIASFLLIFLLLAPAHTGAQVTEGRESVFDDYLNPRPLGSFLNIPGLKFESSVGFSYMSCGSGFSAGYGFYVGHFSLNLTSNITLRWDLGLRSMMTGPEQSRAPEFFIPNVDLTYRKSDNFTIRLQFQQIRYPYYFNSGIR